MGGQPYAARPRRARSGRGVRTRRIHSFRARWVGRACRPHLALGRGGSWLRIEQPAPRRGADPRRRAVDRRRSLPPGDRHATPSSHGSLPPGTGSSRRGRAGRRSSAGADSLWRRVFCRSSLAAGFTTPCAGFAGSGCTGRRQRRWCSGRAPPGPAQRLALPTRPCLRPRGARSPRPRSRRRLLTSTAIHRANPGARSGEAPSRPPSCPPIRAAPQRRMWSPPRSSSRGGLIVEAILEPMLLASLRPSSLVSAGHRAGGANCA
jgi:hypothetical protein